MAEQHGPDLGRRIDLGGGDKPKAGFVNVDRSDVADVRLDLERDRLPWPDASVSEVHASHSLEHIRNLKHVLHEVVRVCEAGARFTVVAPYWLHSMAMCYDHVHTLSEEQISHWCDQPIAEWWFGGCPRRLRLLATTYTESERYPEAQALHPTWTREQVLRYVPGACRQVEYVMQVVDYDA